MLQLVATIIQYSFASVFPASSRGSSRAAWPTGWHHYISTYVHNVDEKYGEAKIHKNNCGGEPQLAQSTSEHCAQFRGPCPSIVLSIMHGAFKACNNVHHGTLLSSHSTDLECANKVAPNASSIKYIKVKQHKSSPKSMSSASAQNSPLHKRIKRIKYCILTSQQNHSLKQDRDTDCQ